jgi:hypothetical protein
VLHLLPPLPPPSPPLPRRWAGLLSPPPAADRSYHNNGSFCNRPHGARPNMAEQLKSKRVVILASSSPRATLCTNGVLYYDDMFWRPSMNVGVCISHFSSLINLLTSLFTSFIHFCLGYSLLKEYSLSLSLSWRVSISRERGDEDSLSPFSLLEVLRERGKLTLSETNSE